MDSLPLALPGKPTWMFIVALFIIDNIWNLLSSPPVNQLWFIQTVEYSSALKRNELSNHGKTEKAQMGIIKWKKSVWKDYLLHDSNYMTFLGRQNYGDRKKISGCQGLRWGVGWTGRAQRIFRAWKYSVKVKSLSRVRLFATRGL